MINVVKLSYSPSWVYEDDGVAPAEVVDSLPDFCREILVPGIRCAGLVVFHVALILLRVERRVECVVVVALRGEFCVVVESPNPNAVASLQKT